MPVNFFTDVHTRIRKLDRCIKIKLRFIKNKNLKNDNNLSRLGTYMIWNEVISTLEMTSTSVILQN